MTIDQASTLREKFCSPSLTFDDPGNGVRAISITSGKGGVGKTNVVINLAIQLAKLGKRVFIMDGDLGLANVDIILNLSPKYTIEDVLMGKRSINDVIVEGPEGIHILPASSGLAEMSELNRDQQMGIFEELGKLQSQYDYFLIDTGAGISSNVLRFNASVDEIFVVTTPEPTSITDAYALMKIMTTKYQVRQFNLIVNQARHAEAIAVFKRLETVSKRFLPLELVFSGHIPKDKKISESVKHRMPISLYSPHSEITSSFMTLAMHISGQQRDPTKPNGFWQRISIWKKVNRHGVCFP